MQLLFLGSGSAFTIGEDNYQCNVIISRPASSDEPAKHLLIDCGSDIRFSLHQLGLQPTDISDIYISHLHSDHIGGLEYIGFNTLFHPDCPRPNLYVSKDIVSDLWERSLSGGMRAIEGDVTTLETYFKVHAIGLERCFIWEHICFNLIAVPHVNTGFNVMPTYGLQFNLGGTKIFFTTDTQFAFEKLEAQYKEADLIFHDCETGLFPTPVHSRYDQLLTLPTAIRQKMWLCGYQPGPKPDAQSDGFLGFVERGQVFEFAPTVQNDYSIHK